MSQNPLKLANLKKGVEARRMDGDRRHLTLTNEEESVLLQLAPKPQYRTALSQGAKEVCKLLFELEPIANLCDLSLREVLNRLPGLARLATRDYRDFKVEQSLVCYLSRRSQEGDREASELLERLDLHSAELVEGKSSGNAWIV